LIDHALTQTKTVEHYHTTSGLDESGRITQWKDTSDSNANTSGHNSNSGTTASGDDILTRMKDRNMRDLSYLINKPPRWNEQVCNSMCSVWSACCGCLLGVICSLLYWFSTYQFRLRSLRSILYVRYIILYDTLQVGAYVLNFNGRVTMASVKNFQLVDPDEQNAVVLQVCAVQYCVI